MHTRELAIQFPDGTSRRIPLAGQRLTLGRSSENDLAYPEDSILSRRHLVLDFDGQEWCVEDLGSTNGTQVNKLRVKGRQRLQLGDTITAGRLVLRLTIPAEPDFDVQFFEDDSPVSGMPHVEVYSQPGGLSSQAQTLDAASSQAAAPSGSRFHALLNAGREIAGDRPVSELFGVVLELIVRAVGASRGVILLEEKGMLVPRAMIGSGFNISTAVRDRVMISKESVLILDASRHEVLRSSTTIQRQRVRSLMAVPLQAKDHVLGLVYVDSQDEMRFFLHEDLTLLAMIANMAAVRIEQGQRAASTPR